MSEKRMLQANYLPCSASCSKDLFNDERSFISIEEGKSYLKDRLRRAPLLRALIVVDDIDHVDQLNALAVMDISNKSTNNLVIVTTRDAGVLINAGITHGYNLEGMNSNDATELFCWHAFCEDHPLGGYEMLVKEFVDVCGGLPLSLQVLGRHVRGRAHKYWSSLLDKVRKTLPRDVKQRLLISFDALDEEEKQVFMDVACFFLSKPKSMAERVCEGSGWSGQHALETLKDRCLVAEQKPPPFFNNKWEIVLRMHDHLTDLGREMARELSSPSRPWHPHDLKSLNPPSGGMMMIGKAVDAGESILNEYVFSEAHIGAALMTDGTQYSGDGPLSNRNAFIDCYLVVVDSLTGLKEMDYITEFLGGHNQDYEYCHNQDYEHYDDEAYYFNVYGKLIVTRVQCCIDPIQDRSHYLKKIDYLSSGGGMIKRRFHAEMKSGEEWRIMDLLRRIVDKIYYL